MSTELDPRRIPVIVGVGDIKSGSAGESGDLVAPVELVYRAVERASEDAGASGLGPRLDTVRAIRTTSWAYDDLPGLVADRLGASPHTRSTSAIGGHFPAQLLDRIGHDIAAGTSEVALLVGGEAQASVRAMTKSGTDPRTLGWVCEPGGPPTFDPEDLGSSEMQRAGILAPVQIYPLFENGRAGSRGVGPKDNLAESAHLYSRFSSVAARHPVAWSAVERTAAGIATVTESNRAVSDCYPLSMNAMPFVDQAVAVVVCSLAVAQENGIAEDRLVYLWGGAGADDSSDVLARSTFDHSPALRTAVRRTLSLAGITGSQLSIVDAYSCFPIVPKLLIDELGLAPDSTPTVLGGHSFFGGPLSSYSLHATAETVRLLRKGDRTAIAMVHANGGYLTHQHIVLLSSTAHAAGYIGEPVAVQSESAEVPIVHGYTGDARIETDAVTYGRTGEPEHALVVASNPTGERIAGRTDAEFAAVLARLIEDRDISPAGLAIELTDHNGTLTVTLSDETSIRTTSY